MFKTSATHPFMIVGAGTKLMRFVRVSILRSVDDTDAWVAGFAGRSEKALDSNVFITAHNVQHVLHTVNVMPEASTPNVMFVYGKSGGLTDFGRAMLAEMAADKPRYGKVFTLEGICEHMGEKPALAAKVRAHYAQG